MALSFLFLSYCSLVPHKSVEATEPQVVKDVRVEQVEIFYSSVSGNDALQDYINRWFSEKGSKVSVIRVCQSGSYDSVVISIFYQQVE